MIALVVAAFLSMSSAKAAIVKVWMEVEIAADSPAEADQQAKAILEGCRKAVRDEKIRFVHDESGTEVERL